MSLCSVWADDGEYLTNRKQKIKARSEGCECCSVALTDEHSIKKKAIEGLAEILLALYYYGWDLEELLEKAKRNEKIKKWKG